MSKLFILLFLWAYILNASVTKEEAVANFEAQNYQTSYEQFRTLFFNNMNDQTIDFYYGRSAFETKRYYEAQASFERLLENDQNDLRIQLELARTYYTLDMTVLAIEAFEKLKKNPLPSAVLEKVNAFLDELYARDQAWFVTGAIALSYAQEQNINYAIDASEFYVDKIDLTVPAAKQLDDTVSHAMGSLNILYHPKKSSSFEVFSQLLALTHDYANENDFDYNFYFMTLGTSFGVGSTTLKLPLQYSKLDFAGESLFAIQGISPSLLGQFNDKAMWSFNLQYDQKRYTQMQNESKDTNTIGVGFQSLLNLAKLHTVSLSGAYKSEVAVDNYNNDFYIDRDLYEIGFKYSYTASKAIDIIVSNSIQWLTYDDEGYFIQKRKDDNLYSELKVNWAIGHGFAAGMYGSRFANRSNHAPYEYTKTTLGVTTSWTF